jgi:hypothetical protein
MQKEGYLYLLVSAEDMPPYRFSFTGFIIGWIAKLLYFASLTTLIPFGAMLLTARPAEIPASLQYLPWTALGLLFLSAFVLLVYHRNLAHTLASLGWMTLLPGIGALVFMIVDPQTVLGFIAKLVVGFGKVEPLVESYLNDVLPKVWLFIAVYILLGFVLISIAGKMESKHALMSHFRKIFGPRVRFFR